MVLAELTMPNALALGRARQGLVRDIAWLAGYCSISGPGISMQRTYVVPHYVRLVGPDPIES